MARLRNPNLFLTFLFMGIIAAPGLVQVLIETGRGERPRVLDVFTIKPTARNLNAYEKSLEEASWVAAELRPWMQYAQFQFLGEAGDQALIGRDGWFFYKPGVEYLTRRPPAAGAANQACDPLPAIVAFRDALAARGVRLLLLPMPNKESVYPDKLAPRAVRLQSVMGSQTRSLLERTRAAGVDVIDLFAFYANARRTNSGATAPPLYLAQDSHWSPAGVVLTAKAVADWLVQQGWASPSNTAYMVQPAPVQRVGDVPRMLQSRWIDRQIPPEPVICSQVIGPDGKLYQDDPSAEILVLGDSFMRLYERDEPRAAGFIAHLARELKQPLTSIVNDGGASTLVRQELYRRPALLAHKRVVIWEFVERDIRLGTEGWQIVPLPPVPARSGARSSGQSASVR